MSAEMFAATLAMVGLVIVVSTLLSGVIEKTGPAPRGGLPPPRRGVGPFGIALLDAEPRLAAPADRLDAEPGAGAVHRRDRPRHQGAPHATAGWPYACSDPGRCCPRPCVGVLAWCAPRPVAGRRRASSAPRCRRPTRCSCAASPAAPTSIRGASGAAPGERPQRRRAAADRDRRHGVPRARQAAVSRILLSVGVLGPARRRRRRLHRRLGAQPWCASASASAATTSRSIRWASPSPRTPPPRRSTAAASSPRSPPGSPSSCSTSSCATASSSTARPPPRWRCCSPSCCSARRRSGRAFDGHHAALRSCSPSPCCWCGRSIFGIEPRRRRASTARGACSSAGSGRAGCRRCCWCCCRCSPASPAPPSCSDSAASSSSRRWWCTAASLIVLRRRAKPLTAAREPRPRRRRRRAPPRTCRSASPSTRPPRCPTRSSSTSARRAPPRTRPKRSADALRIDPEESTVEQARALGIPLDASLVLYCA